MNALAQLGDKHPRREPGLPLLKPTVRRLVSVCATTPKRRRTGGENTFQQHEVCWANQRLYGLGFGRASRFSTSASSFRGGLLRGGLPRLGVVVKSSVLDWAIGNLYKARSRLCGSRWRCCKDDGYARTTYPGLGRQLAKDWRGSGPSNSSNR